MSIYFQFGFYSFTMSRRALRRLQGAFEEPQADEEEEVEDNDAEEVVKESAWGAFSKPGKKKKKHKPQNVRGSNGEAQEVRTKVEESSGRGMDEEAEEEVIDTQPTRKNNKKDKGKGGRKGQAADEDLDSMLEKFASKVANVSAASSSSTDTGPKDRLLELLQCQAEFFNPANELRRLFGRAALAEEKTTRDRGGNRGKGGLHMRKTTLVKAKEDWPPHSTHGLSIIKSEPTKKEGSTEYMYTHSLEYQHAEQAFIIAASGHDPNRLVAVLQRYPYHLQTLLQLSTVYQLTGNNEQANEFIARALYALEIASYPSGFSWTNPLTHRRRLPYSNPSNQVVHRVLEKRCQMLCKAGNWRTALEFAKLLYSLDPAADPCAALLFMDYYAVRAAQWEFLKGLREALARAGAGLYQLPGLMYNEALGMYLDEAGRAGGGAELYKGDRVHQHSCRRLQEAMLLHPAALVRLQDRCGVGADDPWRAHPLFAKPCASPVFSTLFGLFAEQGADFWKRKDIQGWVRSTVDQTLKYVAKNLGTLADLRAQREALYDAPELQIYADVRAADMLGPVE